MMQLMLQCIVGDMIQRWYDAACSADDIAMIISRSDDDMLQHWWYDAGLII